MTEVFFLINVFTPISVIYFVGKAIKRPTYKVHVG